MTAATAAQISAVINTCYASSSRNPNSMRAIRISSTIEPTKKRTDITINNPLRTYLERHVLQAVYRIESYFIYKYNIAVRVGSSSVKLDGINDYVELGVETGLWSQALTKFSFSVWFYQNGSPGSGIFPQILSHNWATGAGAFSCHMDSPAGVNTIYFIVKKASLANVQASCTGLVTDQWNHVAGVYDNSLGSANMKIYLNGTLGSVTINLTETLTNAGYMRLAEVLNDLKGSIKDFRWFTTKALTQAEINDIIANRPSAPTPDYWLKMLEGTGNPVDSISGTKIGTLTNGATWSNTAPDILTGKATTSIYNILQRVGSSSLLFDGSNDYVDMGTETGLWSQTLTKFSFSFWINIITVPSSIPNIVKHGWAAIGSFICYYDQATNNFWFAVRNLANVGKFASSTTVVTLGQWYHVTCVYDNSLGSQNVKLYVNSVVGSVTSSTTDTMTLSTTLTLSTSSLGMNMNIKDFRWWTTKALTQTEINDVYANNPGAPTPDYWLKITEGSGNPVDSISGTKTGVLTGGTTWTGTAPNILIGKTSKYLYNILTKVSLSRIYKYNILGRVSLSRIYKYNILGRVSLSRIYKYNITKLVSSSMIYKYNILGRVSLSRIYKYNILDRISQSRIYKYNIVGRTSLTRTYKYNILGRVSQSRTYKYNIANLVSLSRTFKYAILSRASLSRIYQYSILGRVSLPRTFRYHILGRASASYTFLYNILEATLIVSKTIQFKYDIIGRTSKSFTAKYRILPNKMFKLLTVDNPVGNFIQRHKIPGKSSFMRGWYDRNWGDNDAFRD